MPRTLTPPERGHFSGHYLGVVSVHDHYNIIYIIYNAMNTDSARIRPFLGSFFGLSPMNVDMSVFMAIITDYLCHEH